MEGRKRSDEGYKNDVVVRVDNDWMHQQEDNKIDRLYSQRFTNGEERRRARGRVLRRLAVNVSQSLVAAMPRNTGKEPITVESVNMH